MTEPIIEETMTKKEAVKCVLAAYASYDKLVLLAFGGIGLGILANFVLKNAYLVIGVVTIILLFWQRNFLIQDKLRLEQKYNLIPERKGLI